MCGIVGYTGPRGRPDPDGGAPAARVPRLRLGRDRPGRRRRATCSSRSGPGSWPTSRPAIADRTPHAAIGLAHTRWATHGRPNDVNAHPQQDCTGEITVIHNGIIENFRELRDGLERAATRSSPRPTPRRSRILSRRPTTATSPRPRGRAAAARGAYALAIMHRDESDRLVGARKDVPLVVGLGEGESFLASDVVGDPRPHQTGHLPRGGRRRRPAAGRRRSPTSTAGGRWSASHDDRLDDRGRREGRLRDLHAQGDPRAAGGARPVADRPDPAARIQVAEPRA